MSLLAFKKISLVKNPKTSITSRNNGNNLLKPKPFSSLTHTASQNKILASNKNNFFLLSHAFGHQNRSKFRREKFIINENMDRLALINNKLQSDSPSSIWNVVFAALAFFAVSTAVSDDEIEARDDSWKEKAKRVELPFGKYFGEVNSQGQPHGFGEVLCTASKTLPKSIPPDSIYRGLWKDGKMHGLGKILSEDGTVLVMSFDQNEAKAAPIFLSDAAGTFVYTSTMINGAFGGDVLISDIFNYYEGGFDETGPTGFGKYLEEDGTYYEGNHFRGKRWGKGRMVSPEPLNLELSGEFQDDILWEGVAVNKNFNPPIRVKVTEGNIDLEQLKIKDQEEDPEEEHT